MAQVITSAGSVLALAYKNGVVIAADTQINYGKTARYFHCPRTHQISDSCIISASGEYADFQEITSILDDI
ncbi:MAG: hypothetical protein EZS28_044684, partial [Streblomastix strix]